ncbi:MAG: chromate transporter [Oscillospiraceae bacterium]
MIYLRLFLNFCLIGSLAFGGGYAALPLISEQCVNQNGWLTLAEFSDLLTISQITPGPIAINSASFVGMKVAGLPGAVVASVGFMLPPFILVTVLFFLFKKYGKLAFMQNILSGLKPAVAALIAVAAADVLAELLFPGNTFSFSSIDILSAALTLAAFFALRKKRLGAIATILSCGAVGVLREVLTQLLG